MSQQLGVPVFKVFNGIFWQHVLENGTHAGMRGRSSTLSISSALTPLTAVR